MKKNQTSFELSLVVAVVAYGAITRNSAILMVVLVLTLYLLFLKRRVGKGGRGGGGRSSGRSSSSRSSATNKAAAGSHTNTSKYKNKKKACFSGNMLMLRGDGTVCCIGDVEEGDEVVTADRQGRLVVDEVIRVSHPPNQDEAVFLKLVLESGDFVELTPDHYLPVNRLDNITTAMNVYEGDRLRLATGSWSRVVRVERISSEGTYNLWLSGTPYLCVNGIVATPCSRANAWVEMANERGLLPLLTVPFARLVRTLNG